MAQIDRTIQEKLQPFESERREHAKEYETIQHRKTETENEIVK